MGSFLTLPLVGLTYLGVALGGYPRLRMNRATVAFVGAVGLIAVGIVPLEAALTTLDANTLILLFAMMVVNGHLEMAGFFQGVGAWDRAPTDPLLLRKSLALIGLMLIAFVVGVPIPLAAMSGAAILLITRRTDPERIFARVDWSFARCSGDIVEANARQGRQRSLLFPFPSIT